MSDEVSLYERAGGMAFFQRLVDAFYDGVAGDEVLVRLYPDAPDLRQARRTPRSAGTPDCGCATCASRSAPPSVIAGSTT
jgi:hypothetical protein